MTWERDLSLQFRGQLAEMPTKGCPTCGGPLERRIYHRGNKPIWVYVDCIACHSTWEVS